MRSAVPRRGGSSEILSIGLAEIDYLAEALRTGVRTAPITNVRYNAPFGVLCEVHIAIAGLREHRNRTVAVATSWELRHPADTPRLVTAYIDG